VSWRDTFSTRSPSRSSTSLMRTLILAWISTWRDSYARVISATSVKLVPSPTAPIFSRVA
jgi:hypothetical protein